MLLGCEQGQIYLLIVIIIIILIIITIIIMMTVMVMAVGHVLLPVFMFTLPMLYIGRAMAQAVSRRPLTTEARVRSRVSPCGCSINEKTNHLHHRVAQEASGLRCVRSIWCGALHSPPPPKALYSYLLFSHLTSTLCSLGINSVVK
jgi:hypothetical protein